MGDELKRGGDPESAVLTRSSSIASDASRDLDGVTIIDLLIVLGQEKKLLFGLPAISMLIATVVSLFLPVWYTATTTFLPPQQQGVNSAALQQLGGLASIAGAAAGVKKPEDLYIAILGSQRLRNALVRSLDLMRRYDATILEDARFELEKNVSVSADKAGLIRIEASDRDPAFAAQLANAHVEELRRLMGELAVTEAQQRRAFLQMQLASTKENLVKAEIALKQTQERTGLIALDKQGEAMIRTAADLRAQIAAREVQLQGMRSFATTQNADVQRIIGERDELKAQLAKVEAGQVLGQGSVIVPTGRVPEAGLQYIRAAREVKYHEVLFELLARQFELAKVDEAREGLLVQQVDVASPPERKSRPRRAQIVLLVGVATLLGALAWVLVRAVLMNILADPVGSRQLAMLRSVWRVGKRA